jgi:dUTP pyrophosphatase
MLTVQFKKLSERAIIPTKGSEIAIGYDIVATSRSVIKNGVIKYGTGIAVDIPKNYGLYIYPRSSISKMDMRLANSIGVIDPDYRGEIFIPMEVINMVQSGNIKRIRDNDLIYKVGDRIAQAVLLPRLDINFKEVETLSDTNRGKGGFGSTGRD